MSVTYFFDMDGVLANYHRETYIPGPMWYHRYRDQHYFAHLEPYLNMTALLDELITLGETVYILTSLGTSRDDVYDEREHREDKLAWIVKHIPHFPLTNVIFSYPSQNMTKVDTVEYVLRRKITPLDILLDDYNENLKAWNVEGGSAVKVLNGLNSLSDYDHHIHITKDPESLLRRLDDVVDTIKVNLLST